MVSIYRDPRVGTAYHLLNFFKSSRKSQTTHTVPTLQPPQLPLYPDLQLQGNIYALPEARLDLGTPR